MGDISEKIEQLRTQDIHMSENSTANRAIQFQEDAGRRGSTRRLSGFFPSSASMPASSHHGETQAQGQEEDEGEEAAGQEGRVDAEPVERTVEGREIKQVHMSLPFASRCRFSS